MDPANRGAVARTDGPQTSALAAKSLSAGNLTQVQKAVYILLAKYGPMTDEQLIDRYREAGRSSQKVPSASDSSIRTRRSELVEAGLVRAAGEARTRSGRLAQLWKPEHIGS